MYLLGELWIDAEKVSAVTEIGLYRPVSWSSDRIRLHYAQAEDLREYRLRGAVLAHTLPSKKPSFVRQAHPFHL